jgi:hypothetical protein
MSKKKYYNNPHDTTDRELDKRYERRAAEEYRKRQQDIPAEKYAEGRGREMAGKIDKALAGGKDVRYIVKDLHDDPLMDVFPMTKEEVKVKSMEKGIEEGTKEIKRKQKQRGIYNTRKYHNNTYNEGE